MLPVDVTVANDTSEDDHTPPTVALVKFKVEPTQTLLAPAIAATVGVGKTVTFVIADVEEHPLASVIVTVDGPSTLTTILWVVSPEFH